MKKFWNKAADGSADIYIYGDIVTYDWFDSDTTAKKFVDDLNSFGGKDVTVHLNSGGGDVFQALAIYNSLKNYSGNVKISIDGLAASAASLVAMAGNKITMANNSLMMIHSPAVGLFGFYAADELSKVQNQLDKVQASIVATYESRLKNSGNAEKISDLQEMIQAETWLNAQEALSNGFIDEITDAVDLKIDDAQQKIFVNSLAISTKNFDAEKMRRAMGVKNMEIKDEQGFFDKLKATITDALTPKTAEEKSAPVVDAEQIRQQELSRIRDLTALKCDNAAVNSIVDVAIKDGRAVADVQPYIDAIKKIPSQPTAQDAADKIVAVIRDQLTSGAEGVQSGQPAPTQDELDKAKQKRIADIANEMIGGKAQ